MRTRSLLMVAGLLVVAAVAGGQPPPDIPPAVSPPPGPTVIPVGPYPGGPPLQYVPPGLNQPLPAPHDLIPPVGVPSKGRSPGVPSKTTPPAEKSVEQLLKDLAALQAQKADILRKEAELKATIQKKLEAVGQEAEKLGVGPGEKKAGAAPAGHVGRIIIEGEANKKVEYVAREAVKSAGLVPGAEYRRAALDQAREMMVAGGLTRASLETITSGRAQDGSSIIDIRVRIAPEGDR